MMNNVLIVEDDKDIRDVLFRYLKIEGFNVFEAATLQEMNNVLKEVKIV